MNIIDLFLNFNFIIPVVFTLCYFYQFVYIVIGLLKKYVPLEAKANHKYAVVISARNEANVIGNLITSIKEQKYPQELIDILVVADNCTDNTAQVARDSGATVYERFDDKLVGKGYALDWLFQQLKKDMPDNDYEAYIVFDADNVVDPNFVTEMNKSFDNGYRILTSYRNSKNYSQNWISAGYSLWFIREARFLNNPRTNLGTSCAISGTGFLVSAEIIKKNGGWIHHLLTEDIEFSVDSVLHGETIGYCEKAIVYDEQPVTFYQSYLQRLRWSKGFYQVFMKYGGKLLKGMLKGDYSCYDLLMVISPASILTIASTILNAIAIPFSLIFDPEKFVELLMALGGTIVSIYTMFFFVGVITTITEFKQIHCPLIKKILYTFTFPLFMLTYIPISVIALFKKVKWDPIKHSVSKSVSDICAEDHAEVSKESIKA